MSERQPRSGSEGRMSSSPPRPLRRVRMLTTGRWHAPLDARLMPTVIAVGAAERGLGKSIVVSNLAASIAGLGRRVLVVDLDFRAPRQHTVIAVGVENRDDLFDFFDIPAVRLLVTTRATRALEATYAFLKGAALRAEP